MRNKNKTDSKLPTNKTGEPNMSKVIPLTLWAKTQQVPKCKTNTNCCRIQLPSCWLPKCGSEMIL